MECDLILMFNASIPWYYAVLFLIRCTDAFASYMAGTLVRWKGGNMTDGAWWQLRQLLREGTTQVHLRGSGHPQCVIHKYCLRFMGSVAGGRSSVWHVHEPESRSHRSWSQIPDPRGAEIGVTDSESSLVVGIPRSYGLAVTQLRSTIHLPTRRQLRDKSAPSPPHRFSCWGRVTVVKSQQDIFCPWTEWAEWKVELLEGLRLEALGYRVLPSRLQEVACWLCLSETEAPRACRSSGSPHPYMRYMADPGHDQVTLLVLSTFLICWSEQTLVQLSNVLSTWKTSGCQDFWILEYFWIFAS